ncbi:uncharacterized protein L3040_007979 [Drepanopeziza brunnea f. sp. 'multigermtubi']|uniref:uncharacterized protein n=1 Tax=Drepanopeziza brunnea f. sp. 'multigermtubi' TaxID=698441 RepID=UPI00239B5F63|nr:hypothetical protein L3040_007979 [Drepanopeziza brunnea f. sp. 'multigermtubi']
MQTSITWSRLPPSPFPSEPEPGPGPGPGPSYHELVLRKALFSLVHAISHPGLNAKAAYTSSASPRPKVERTSEHEAAAPSPAMAQAPRSLFALFLIALLAMTLVSASHGHGIARATHSAGEEQIFQEMLNSVDPKALRGVLLAATEKYKHGVFQEDRKAMEALHQENAEAATYFLELAKRQSGNITAVSTTESSTVVPVLPSTPVAESTPTAPGPTPTTPTPGPTSEPQSPSVAVDPTTLPTPPASTSRNQAAEPTASETSPAAQAPAPATSTTSPAEEPATTSTNRPAVTSAPNTAPSTPQTSPGQSTDDQSSPSSTLLTEASTNQKPTSAFSITQQIIYTTTLVGGKAITVTSLMVVPGQTDGTAPGPSKTSAAKGSLQTNAGSTPKNRSASLEKSKVWALAVRSVGPGQWVEVN